MPNWCENRMTIAHTDPTKIDEVVEAAKNRSEEHTSEL